MIHIVQQKTDYDICIIGGGASGMTAAIVAAETNPNASICVIEKKESLGKKLLATGNGRCNITNNRCEDFTLTENFLYNHGILIKHEAEGRMYPKSEQAASVLELLEEQIKMLHIHVKFGVNVGSILKKQEHFEIIIEQADGQRTWSCRKLLIATGGKAAPQFGTTGDGYSFARSLGHHVEKLAPSLMPICCEGVEKELKGVRAKAKVSLLKNGQPLVMTGGCEFSCPKIGPLVEELGEVQFTEDGLSGICIFNLSRFLKLEVKDQLANAIEQAFRQYQIEMDLIPEMEQEEVKNLLRARKKIMAELPLRTWLLSLVPVQLGESYLRVAVGESWKNMKVEEITDAQINKLVELLKKRRYTVTGGKGWKSAQCTAGGVSLQEVHIETMESKLIQGLFFAGEVLDYDGPCGGYNLQHAWITGMKAGQAMAR